MQCDIRYSVTHNKVHTFNQNFTQKLITFISDVIEHNLLITHLWKFWYALRNILFPQELNIRTLHAVDFISNNTRALASVFFTLFFDYFHPSPRACNVPIIGVHMNITWHTHVMATIQSCWKFCTREYQVVLAKWKAEIPGLQSLHLHGKYLGYRTQWFTTQISRI